MRSQLDGDLTRSIQFSTRFHKLLNLPKMECIFGAAELALEIKEGREEGDVTLDHFLTFPLELQNNIGERVSASGRTAI